MRKSGCFAAVLFIFCNIHSQQTSFNFDFGFGKTAPGYIQIISESKFNYHIGYGLDQNSLVESIDRGGDPLTSDFITGNKPFFFSVKLPEGNYDVKVILGDIKGTSATTVRAECRRLFLPNIQTKKGEIKTENFTVHVKDSIIRDANNKPVDKVKLKEREINYRHWDNQLTLEFNGQRC